MWTYNYTDELYHYGVLGMKWGRRRAGNQTLKSKLKSKYKLHSDPEKELAEVEGDKSKYTSTGHKKRGNQTLKSKLKSKYKLHSDPEKELAEVEGDKSKYTSTGHKKRGNQTLKSLGKKSVNLGKRVLDDYLSNKPDLTPEGKRERDKARKNKPDVIIDSPWKKDWERMHETPGQRRKRKKEEEYDHTPRI